MYRFACKDLDVDCDFAVRADSPEAVKEQVMAHADETHHEMMAAMSPAELTAMQQAIAGAIKPV